MISIHFLFAFVLLVSALLVVPTFAQVAPFAPASTNAPPFPIRSELVATTFYGRTYIFGGVSSINNQPLNDVWVSSDDGVNWQLQANTGLPPRYKAAFVTVQTMVNSTQLLLVVGGRGADSAFSNEVYFSLNGQTFIRSSLAAFSPRAEFAYTIALPIADQSGNPQLNGLRALFIIGGDSNNGPLNDVWYSSGRGQFNYVLATANAPWSARRFFSAVSVESGSRIVITGGTNGYDCFNDVWLSAVGGFTWIQLPTAPFAQRYGFGFVNIAEKLSLFGGTGPQGDSNEIWSSLDYGRSWDKGSVNAAFTPRVLFGTAVNGKDVAIIDGAGSGIAGNSRVLNGAVN